MKGKTMMLKPGKILFILLITFLMSSAVLAQTKTPTVQLITVNELKSQLSANQAVTIIDVRSSEGYAQSDKRIKGAIHVKLRRLQSRIWMPPLKDVPRDQQVVTYCACPSEHSSIEAAQVLLSSGFKNVKALKGGWVEWLKISGQVESKPKG
jgi:rhodanese-related sulfurtransferase